MTAVAPGLWWLSFVDPERPVGEQFLGVALVEGSDVEDVLRRAWREGCNPGGEVASYALDLDALSNAQRVILARAPKHTLLSRDDLAEHELV